MDDGMNNIENSAIQEIMDTDDNESSSSVPNDENGLGDDNLELDNQDKMFENEESSDTNGLVEELDSNDGLLTKEGDRSPEEIIGEVSSPIQDNVINEVMEDSEVAEDSESKDGVIEINEDSASMDVTEISEVEGVLRDDSDSNAISETAEVFANESSVTIEEVDETSSDLLKTIDNSDEEQVGNVIKTLKGVQADFDAKIESLAQEEINAKVTLGIEKVEAQVEPGKVEANVEDDKEIAPVEELEAEENIETKKVSDTNKAVASSDVEMKDLEKKKVEIKRGDAEETEIVSEDELPQVEKPRIKDAENVSDDELPGPKPAEMPADTEVVSEDELPTVKKDSVSETRKRKNEETKNDTKEESESKKQAIAKNGESKPVSEKAATVEEKPAPKVLPELDKYWKVVNDDPTDFTGWTYLLQYVDQENDVEAARGAYDAFLSHYPYCYGYWRKYSDYEKRKGSKKKCNEVLERGLKAIPLSVDLWIHYLNHIKSTRTEDLAFIRSQYERAIEACGLEFRSDRLWESYVKWEAENGSALNVTNIYDRLLATPTMSYTTHFDNFQEHVMSEPVSGVVSRAELIRLRTEVRAGGKPPQLDLPPGEDEPDDHIASEEEGQAIKDRIIAIRKKVHKTTADEVAARWTFEEGIKRPYFHVKPLERCQLKNWKAYLEWEKQNGSFKRAYILHERCLIACALYDEFWLKLVRLLEERATRDPSVESVQRSVLERACSIHHARRPALHLCWSSFEEAHGDAARAAQILEKIDETCPDVLEVQCRRINLERRRGDLEKCAALYQQYIAGAKTKAIGSALAIKYARFLRHVRNDLPAAREALDAAIVTNPLDPRLHLQRLDLALHTPDTPFSVLDELVGSYSQQEGAEAEVSLMFAWRRRELAEELGDLPALRAALAAHADAARRPRPSKTEEASKKKEATSNNSAAAPSTGAYYANNAPPQNYDQGYATQPYPNNWGYTQPPGPYQPNWQQYPNYY